MAMTQQEKVKRQRDRALLAHHEESYGPQLPGGTYRNGYWGDQYTVEAMWSDLGGPWREAPFLRVRDTGSGEVREHCTAWDPRRDEVVSQPPLRHWPLHPDRRVQRSRDEISRRHRQPG